MAGKAKTQQKRWHLDGGIEVTNIQNENGDQRPSTFLGNYNGDNLQSLALVAYTGSYYDLVDYPNLTNYVVDGNYVHTDNNFTDEDKAKLTESYNYVLPVATEKILGGVKVGDHLEMRVDPKITNPRERASAIADRISVIESHFIYVQNVKSVTRFEEIPTSSAGQMELAAIYSPIGETISGHYIRYNDMVFFSQDASLDTEEFNGKTIKIQQDKMTKGGLWWTTKNTGTWIKVLDQFNIVSFNDRVGKVYPVGMDDYKLEAEDYTADMVGAIARRGEGGNWTEFKNKGGRTVLSLFNGCTLKGLEDNSAGWARIGALGWDEEKSVTKPDPINSPTGGIVTGVYWKYSGLPTLPPVYETTKTGAKKLVRPATYRGINNTSMFFMPDGQDRIWVKRSTGEFDDNGWFYLEQLPIATRTRLGGIMVGNGLDITEEGVLSVSGFVTSWTGKQGARRVNDVVAMDGDYDAKMITFGNEWSRTNNVDYELKRLQQVLDTKAPINSPEFSGRPMAPTPGANDNGKQIVNIEWVRRHVATELQNVAGYTLPPATTNTLGGIIVGNGLSISAAGVLSVNIPSGSGGNVVVDTTTSTTSQNPIANSAITQYVNTVNNKLNDYVLKVNGTAQNLTLTGNAKYTTLAKGTRNDYLATTKFVMDAIDDAIQVVGGGSSGGGSVIINPYTLPPASANARGGVRVTGNDGIKLSNTDVISIDKDYLQGGATYASGGKLDYITAKENITGGTFADIPMNSSGVTRLSAAYSPTAKDMQGYYIKYNAGDNPDSYIMWFCDFDTNNSYYLVYKSASEYAWSMTFAVEGMDNYQDFDIRLYAKLDSPQFTGLPTVPDADTWDDNSSQIANTRFVNTFVNRKIQNQQKAGYGSQFGVVAVKQGGGIKVTGGVIEMDGVVSFKGRKGAVTPQLGDYTSSLINNSSSITGSTVTDALNNIRSNYAPLNSPVFTGVPTIGTGLTKSPVATEYYVRQWKPIASMSDLGMIKVGDGLQISADGTLSTSGAVTGWTGNQGTRQTGEVIATAGDYNSNMIYYDPQDDSKTVRSELDLKAYKTEAWLRKDVTTFNYPLNNYVSEMHKLPPAYTGGKYGSNGAHLTFHFGANSNPYNAYGAHFGTIILKNDAASYDNNVVAVPNVYVAATYSQMRESDHRSYIVWSTQTRLLTTRDLNSPKFTGTPTINNNPIAVSKVADAGLGLVKNGGNIVVDVAGNMNYTLPIASSTVLGGIKIGNNVSVDTDGKLNVTLPIATSSVLGGIKQGQGVTISNDGVLNVNIATSSNLGVIKVGNGLTIASDGTLSTSGAVTTWNSRTGDIVPESGDYTSAQITYDTTKTVKDKLDEIDADILSLTDGSCLPIASATQIGAVKIGDGINVDADGVISMSGVTSFNGRGGAVVPQGDEQDYTADMVGAIARNTNLSVNRLADVPINSAGYLNYTGTTPSPISGGYFCFQSHKQGWKSILVFTSSKESWTNPYGSDSTFSDFSNGGIYFTKYENSSWLEWVRIDGLNGITDLSTLDTGLNIFTGIRQNSITRAINRGGVCKTLINTNSGDFSTSDLGGSSLNAVATYLNVSSDRYTFYNPAYPSSITSGNSIGVQYAMSLAAFYNNETKINGLFYSRSDGTKKYVNNSIRSKWIKLIDTENIYDYVADTSNLYNTENYTAAEISDEITATLAELNA